MEAKILEIRDRGTFFPVICVNMNPGDENTLPGGYPQYEARRYLLRRVGYPCDGRPNVMYTKANGGEKANNDPYYWGDRTNQTALNYIIEHWNEIKDGDVIDVEYILGEKPTKKVSERYETGTL